MTDYDNLLSKKRRRVVDDVYDDRGLAFREIFTRDREGPLPRRSGKGGHAPVASVPVTSVWSAADVAANGMTSSNGGRTIVATTSVWQSARGTVGHASGKYYVEFLCADSPSSNTSAFGIADASFIATSYISSSNYSGGFSNSGGVNLKSSGFVEGIGGSVYQPVLNDVLQVAVDLTAGNVWYGINNTWTSAGNPSTGVQPRITIVTPALGLTFFPAVSVDFPTSGTWTIQSTAATQKYTPPSGFSAWG